MLIRKYRAKNLKEALTQIKQDLGDGATILSTRTVRSGLLRAQLEVTAALPPLESVPKTNKAESLKTGQPPAPQVGLELTQVARFLSPIRQEIRALHTEMKAIAQESRQGERVENTISELRNLLKAIQQSTDPHAGSPVGPILNHLQEKLEASGMRASLVNKVIEQLISQLPPEVEEALACADALAAKVMADELQSTPGLEFCESHRVAALIGPAGVGKTTTLAKIATRAALIHGHSVAIVGCDSDRIGAIRALQDTARLIGVPFQMAQTSADVIRAVDKFAEYQLVLIDTSGYSARDPQAMASLERLLAPAQQVEPYLLLNADMRILEIDANLGGFMDVHPRGLIFTKIDQAVGLGGLYDAASSCGLPVMYLTNGRRVPEDIEEASPERIASLVMGFQYN